MSRRRQKGREVNGILLLDKPSGITSNDALQQVKKLYGAAKAGHTGTLDPLATGMLPLCFGEATKFSQYLLDATKCYRVTAKFGIKTETGDADGEVLFSESMNFTQKQLQEVIEKFVGEIEQIPSMFSAIKHEGQPLYKLARQGIEVARKPRCITIYKIDLLDFRGDEADMEVTCSKGTYIRSLVEDIAKTLGGCAHVQALRRLRVGSYNSAMLSIGEIETVREAGGYKALDPFLLPLSTSVEHWPAVMLGDTAAYYIKQGQAVQAADHPDKGWIRILQESDNRFLGVGEILDDGQIAPRRLVKADT